MTNYNTIIIDKEYQQQNKYTDNHSIIPNHRLDRIEQGLHYIFETEMKSSDSIILDYKPDVIRRIAAFLSGMIKRGYKDINASSVCTPAEIEELANNL